jgi:diguanylate cyclase (GGDEF)-like protein
MYLNYHDKLTGLYNRTYFEQQKINLDRSSQFPVSIIIGDVNGLKIINDSLGHSEGDKILITVAVILKSCCNKDHIIARIGGDEFGIILPNTDSEAVLEVVKRINLAYEEHNKGISGDLNYTSISLGYASKTNDDETLDKVQKNAEENMYKHKLLESRSLHSAIIASIKTALHAKSQETEEHAQRLVKLSRAVGERIGLTDEQFDALELFSALHDIGKIGIHDQILNKPARLTEEEWLEMKKHSEIGYRIAMASPELIHIAEYILTHHERFDGTGYPKGQAGDDIPLLSRIVSVVDAYDAMTEDRPYRKGMSKEEALAEIIRNSGKQFDPRITEIFVDIIMNS